MMILEKFVDWYSEDIIVRYGELWRAGLGSAGCQVWYYDIMSIVQGLEYQRKPRLVHFPFSLFWKIFSVMVMLIYCKDYISGCVNFSFNLVTCLLKMKIFIHDTIWYNLERKCLFSAIIIIKLSSILYTLCLL